MATTTQPVAQQALIDAAVQATLSDLGFLSAESQDSLRERVTRAVEQASTAAREKSVSHYIAVKQAGLEATDRKTKAKEEEAKLKIARAEQEESLAQWKARTAEGIIEPFPENLALISAGFRATFTGTAPGADDTLEDPDDDCEEEVDSDDDQDVTMGENDEPPALTKRKNRARKGPKLGTPPLYKATVIESADNNMIVEASTADIDENVLDRMKKCLALGNHPDTPEREATRALHVASRLMKQYNVTQAEVLAHATPEQRAQLGGHSKVSIERNDGNKTKSVQQQVYVGPLMIAMDTFFGTKSFTTKIWTSRHPVKKGLHITFHGVASNTVAAAMAFEMVHNLMVEWARKHKGVVGRSSYCLGICDELTRAAEQEKRDEMERAKEAEARALAFRLRAEAAQREAELNRLAGPVVDLTGSEQILPQKATVEDEEEEGGTAGEAPSPLPSASSMPTAGGTSPRLDLDDDECSLDSFYSIEDDDSLTDDGDNGVIISDDEAYVDADVDDDDEGVELPADNSDFWNDLCPTTTSKQNPAYHNAHDGRQNDDEMPTKPDNAANRNDSVEPNAQTDEEDSAPTFAGPSQLILWREKESQIADDVLKNMGIKLRSGRKRKWKEFDQEARKVGRADGKKIRPRMRTLKDSSSVGQDNEDEEMCL
ncbi:hypothetical protein Slin15195_G092920 [Septoria linicola]|uniref:DUF2786 domain-containing protein n=1 Tax=Septoria linicola TaxID=215465 RepID=A0A9Q9AZB2_9PEZI|nr:hypothetical protein Slin14017_G056040 [Septoria linicola]USW55973.1 hypothetical protein Slin15195_G092920 [Septoria linicola]